MSKDESILVFAKPAVPGKVKTRLIPRFTPEEAAEFHLAALDDVVETVRRVVGERARLYVAGDEDALDEFRLRYPEVSVWPQRGTDLGARLTQAFEEAFSAACERVVVVGGDHPTVPPEHLAEALTRLRSADVVFGPSRDGGYYAVGIHSQSWPDAGVVFREIPWSTPRVLDASLELARRAGFEVALLPEWYDVDRASDLERVRRDARPDSASARFLEAVERRRR